MKNVQTCAAQGDVMFVRVESIPASHKPKDAEGGRHVVAHSETGHHHYLAAIGVEMLVDPADPMVCYLRLESPADVIHARPFHTHETLNLGAGLWQVRRQREHTPSGWRAVVD